jgi:hypothetical protein
MGYTLKIGELDFDYDQDEDYPSIYLTAKTVSHPDAPAFGEPTDHENQRWPSYTAWAEFCRDAGLYDLFFGKETRDDTLIREHPGCIPLTEKHRREVNAAMEAWKVKYPDAVPTYGEKCPEGEHPLMWTDENNPEENGKMCRLVWLHYWVNWAMDNCERPVFANS